MPLELIQYLKPELVEKHSLATDVSILDQADLSLMPEKSSVAFATDVGEVTLRQARTGLRVEIATIIDADSDSIRLLNFAMILAGKTLTPRVDVREIDEVALLLAFNMNETRGPKIMKQIRSILNSLLDEAGEALTSVGKRPVIEGLAVKSAA